MTLPRTVKLLLVAVSLLLVADVAMIPLGFVGAVGALILLALPVTRRFQREVERPNPG
jgi:hypothetical protein